MLTSIKYVQFNYQYKCKMQKWNNTINRDILYTTQIRCIHYIIWYEILKCFWSAHYSLLMWSKHMFLSLLMKEKFVKLYLLIECMNICWMAKQTLKKTKKQKQKGIEVEKSNKITLISHWFDVNRND